MWNPYRRIGRPAEGHNVLTPEAYRARQAEVIAQNRTARPVLAWRTPFLSLATVQPEINAGRWIVHCADCGNAPLYDPEWQLACCLECGAIFEQVPPPADWRVIEDLLMRRPILKTRNWLPTESLADLEHENAEHGL